jgi:Fe-S-cluster containining protein
MMNEDYEATKRVAEENLARIKILMPPDLAMREEAIFEKFVASKESCIEKLNKLYILVDDLYGFVGKFIPCRRGCNYCCYIEVSISSLEAKYIESNLGIRQTRNLDKKDFFGTPCPFLIQGDCAIYQYRPFVCRRHVALFDNPKWCQLDLCNEYTFPNIRFSEVEKSYSLIVSESGDISLYDIRQLF